MEAAGGRNTLSKTTLSKNEFKLFLKKSCVIYRDAPLSKIPLLKNYALWEIIFKSLAVIYVTVIKERQGDIGGSKSWVSVIKESEHIFSTIKTHETDLHNFPPHDPFFLIP